MILALTSLNPHAPHLDLTQCKQVLSRQRWAPDQEPDPLDSSTFVQRKARPMESSVQFHADGKTKSRSRPVSEVRIKNKAVALSGVRRGGQSRKPALSEVEGDLHLGCAIDVANVRDTTLAGEFLTMDGSCGKRRVSPKFGSTACLAFFAASPGYERHRTWEVVS